MKSEQEEQPTKDDTPSEEDLSNELTPDSATPAASGKQEIISPKELQRWGEAIRHRRRDLGLTLKQLAEMTGISFGYLAKLERGDPDAKNPTRLVVDALRRALNIPAPGGEQLSGAVLASWQSEMAQRIPAPEHRQQ